MIGHEGYALYIRDWHAEYLGSKEYWEADEDSPVGWTRLGAGCYRVAYLSPDGVVYKVQHYLDARYGQTNENEFKNYNRLRLSCKLPTGARFPRMSYHALDGRGVVAMEKLGPTLSNFPRSTEQGATYWRLRDRIERITNMWDMHGRNLAVDEVTNELVPIDLGG